MAFSREIATPPADTTYCGAPRNNITKGLPKQIESICPECAQVIPARMFEEGGKVYMEKTCPEHGYVKDLYWSDVELYLKAEKWEFGDGRGLMNPNTQGAELPGELRDLPGPHQPHRAGQHRPDQPLQPHLPDLFRQRQCHRDRSTSRAKSRSGHAAPLPR